MRCQRCQGWMIIDYFMDLLSGSDELDFTGWRCLNCGAITDPVINARSPTASGRSCEVEAVMVGGHGYAFQFVRKQKE